MSPISDITPTTFHIEKVPFSLEPVTGEILVRVTGFHDAALNYKSLTF